MRAGLGGPGSRFTSAAKPGEGKENRENRFPRLGSLAPYAEVLGAQETLGGVSGPGGGGPADSHSLRAGAGRGRGGGNGLCFPLHRRGN